MAALELRMMVIGLGWFYGYPGVDALFGAFPFLAAMNSAVGFGLMSCVIEIFNGCLLVKTPLGSSPMQFAVVIAVFSQHFTCYWDGSGNGLESHLRYIMMLGSKP